MSRMNSIEKSRYINDRYKEYIRSSFKFDSYVIQELFDKKLNEEILFKGPYVDLVLPFKRGKNIKELVAEGVICDSFLELGDIDFNRPLYSHQEKSIRLANKGRNLVVTTGTGSGKTECFLYPILNEILKEIRKGNDEPGIRALFLYPMNALVNDQMDRIRAILSCYPEIRFGSFTGDTEERGGANYRIEYGEQNNAEIPPNELITREEIRNNVPHLLFTNYSMLEYMLIRPHDHVIFNSQMLKNWRYVVLDEAHTYGGAKGIELSMLMRRLTGLSDKKPRFIITSATLGERGKSEDDIISFANNLTSADYSLDDIIFSERVLPIEHSEYSINSDDYCFINNNKQDLSALMDVCNKYGVSISGSYEALLYELLKKDNNVKILYQLLKDEAKSIGDIKRTLSNLNEQELSALIDLINLAEKDGIGLFDLKYHSFVRPLDGAYLTLGDTPSLSFVKSYYMDGLKAFEIGNCKYCNAMYLFGKISHNNNSGLDYLYQNREIDIYENYGDNENVSLDYFLLENEIKEEAEQSDLIEKYVLCAKCGCIYSAENLNARKCNCDEEYKKTVYRVIYKSSEQAVANNNISRCPCCGESSQRGIVKSPRIGKDEGTALIGQTLYEALDDGQEIEKPKKSIKLIKSNHEKEEESIVKSEISAKQYICFSDSRQQASFTAVFLDSNHVRMLRKRLIWEIIKEKDYLDLSFDEAAALLTKKIANSNLFPNDMSAHKNAWIALLVDLMRVDGSYDGEGVGLYYFDLDLSELMKRIPEDEIINLFGKYSLDKKSFETLIKVTLEVFRTAPAIDYTLSTLTPEEKLNNLEYRRFDYGIKYKLPELDKRFVSFLPIGNGLNKTVRYVMKACSCSREEAIDILNIIFNEIACADEVGILKEKGDGSRSYQIDASRYTLKNYKNSVFYRCSKCGNLTHYNVNNKCVRDGCDGLLEEVDPDVALKDNYYRKQYMIKKIERIVIEEHSAQLNRKQAKEYQIKFKNKDINILSCSTTFEMGVDIGALETVFMRNVPPSPANYVQRAGRAGRRKNSSAYIITFCGTNSHDYNYFQHPERMISGVINPPYFSVLNKKIIVRHLMACCLGFFFRKYPEFYSSVGALVLDGGEKFFNNYISNHPVKLNHYINKRVIPESQYKQYHDFKWFHEMEDKDERFSLFVETTKNNLAEYEVAHKQAIKDNDYDSAKYYSKQKERILKERVLDSLSRYCVIPKYGFPVDLVELLIYDKNGFENKKYDLTRDLRIAISEYAPDSEIIVDKNKYTSKYINLPKINALPKHYFSICSNCGRVNVFLSKKDDCKCNYCENNIVARDTDYYVVPIYGFKTGKTKDSTRMKPKRSYSGEVLYLGGGRKNEDTVSLNSIISIETSADDELLVMNRSYFYLCPDCGYSEIAKGNNNPEKKMVKHVRYDLQKCHNEELNRIRLGHSFRTDVARLSIPRLDYGDGISYCRAISFMYAILEGISRVFEIERNDIDGIVEKNIYYNSYDVLLFDNVPGGAGHVKRLLDKRTFIAALRAALDVVSHNCCDEKSSCYNCLRNYYNQHYHEKIIRGEAKSIIQKLIKGIE